VLGRDPFGGRLEATIGDEKVRGRRIAISRAASAGQLGAPPHILFIGLDDARAVKAALARFRGTPALTVSAAEGFARAGGMIEFRLTADQRVRFDINLEAVQRARLTMSSQLLKVARIVKGAP
jgi:hypothetical protein